MRRSLLPLLLSPALVLIGCWGAQDDALFEPNHTASVAGASSGSSSGAQSGTDSGSSPDQPQGGSTVVVEAASGGGSLSAGSPNGGAVGSGGSGNAGSSSGGSGAVSTPTIESCDSVAGAVTSDLNGHCYRKSSEDLTFAAARDACLSDGGHLVTVTSEAENAFVHGLHEGEHWIGASDGRSDTTAGVGPYTWVDAEAWDYSDWQDGQPNAFNITCPGQTGTPQCFEHCAFQMDSGDWNDRSCWHTIASICEWDVSAPAGAGGSAP